MICSVLIVVLFYLTVLELKDKIQLLMEGLNTSIQCQCGILAALPPIPVG